MQTTWSSVSLKATLLTAVGNSHLYRHLPDWTDHSLRVLSAEPDTRNLDCAGPDSLLGSRWTVGDCEKRTVDIDRPDRSVVAVVSSETLAIVREPDVDYVILRAGEEQVSLFVELDLGQRSFVAWNWKMGLGCTDWIGRQEPCSNIGRCR